MRDEILYMIQRYENKIRGLEAGIEEAGERERDMLVARLGVYRLEVIPDLKRMLRKCPKENKADIIMIFDGEEYPYGCDYDYTTAEEKNHVNELAMQIRKERGCQVEVRVNE